MTVGRRGTLWLPGEGSQTLSATMFDAEITRNNHKLLMYLPPASSNLVTALNT